MKTIITDKMTKRRSKLVMSDKNQDINENLLQIYNNGYENEVKFINQLYLDISFNESINIVKELRLKRAAYKNQDIEKKIYDENTFILLDEIIEKLVKSRLQCFYCHEKLKILYENVRDPLQWTLDRINNNLDHSDSNTIISCLKCNLQRRKKSMEAFRFTKQLKIV